MWEVISEYADGAVGWRGPFANKKDAEEFARKTNGVAIFTKETERFAKLINKAAKYYAKAARAQQEAMEPKESNIPGVLECGSCGSSVMRETGYRYRYCPWCGRRIQWD